MMKIGVAMERINFRQDFVCQTTGDVSVGLRCESTPPSELHL